MSFCVVGLLDGNPIFWGKRTFPELVITRSVLLVLTEELIHKSFSAYGCIQEIRVFKEKGYAFIRWVLSYYELPEALHTPLN